jgi:hypothetical protein
MDWSDWSPLGKVGECKDLIIFDNVGVFSHGEVSEGGFGIPNRVVGAKVDFEFIDKDFKVPHPMCRVGQVHKPWFEPTHHRTIQV